MKKGKQDSIMKINSDLKAKLDKLKIIPEEPYGSVVKRLLEFYENKKKV